MFPCDDDSPGHVDRFDCPLINPQARRMHRDNQEIHSAGNRVAVGVESASGSRLSKGRTTAQGLNDRIFTPHHRRPSAMQPVELSSWQ